MILSKRTLQVLKNFADTNPNILIKKNTKEILTINHMRSVFSSALIDEKFENNILLYDLHEFLKLYKSLSNPDIVKVDNDFIHIKSDDFFVKYRQSLAESLMTPSKYPLMPTKDCSASFRLTKDINSKILKITSTCCLPDVLFNADGKTLKCILLDKKNDLTSKFTFEIGKTKDTFSIFVKVENMNLLSTDYDVVLAGGNIGRFLSTEIPFKTYVATEKDSIWNDNWKSDQSKKSDVYIKLKKLENAYNAKVSKLLSLRKH